jgi:hypothetical protein
MTVIPPTKQEQSDQLTRMCENAYHGLAQVKTEGQALNFDDDESYATTPDDIIQAAKNDKSRWIELRYDPKEDTANIDTMLETVSELIDIELIKGSMSIDDDVYLLIKCLANRYVDDSGL